MLSSHEKITVWVGIGYFEVYHLRTERATRRSDTPFRRIGKKRRNCIGERDQVVWAEKTIRNQMNYRESPEPVRMSEMYHVGRRWGPKRGKKLKGRKCVLTDC